MYYNIKRNNEIIASVVPTGTYDAKIMGDELVNMNFTLSEPIDFLIGDMVEVYGQLFILNVAPTEEKISSIQYNYTLQFESIKYELAKVQLLFPDTNNNLNITDFSIMGDARLTLELIVQNANRVQNGWKLGTVDETETKNISYSANNLLTALTTLADEFKNEFWIDQDKTIHFTTRKEFSGLTLEYGKSKGLRSLVRTSIDASNIVTRLYAVGSTKNIIAEDGNWSNRLMMDVPYLEINTDKYGIIEHTEILDDVFPNRKGKVTAVNASNFLQFSDNTLEFDLNSSDILIPRTSVKVTFNTGQLAGYTFEVKDFGFNNKTKTFELQPNQEEKAITVPSELMHPAVGDEYVLTDIVMPSQYKTEAQAELKQRANEYLTANCDPRLQYSAVSDLFYFEEQNIKIKLGQTVRMLDAAFKLEVDIRVIGLSQDLQDEYNVQIELADEVQISRITRAYLDDRKWENQIIQHQQQIDRNVRRNYLFSREIQENIFDTDGYFDADKIKPLSIETKMLAVGARSQQYTIKDAQFSILNNTTAQNTIGQLIHFTIDDTTEKVWNILAAQINNISAVFNYIYLRCQRNGSNANFIVTTQQLRFDTDPNFYHFEYGYLSSVTDGFRKLKTSYGFSNINGGEITTGKILGQNGQTFIDIDNRKIYGSVEFLPDSPAFEQVRDSIEIGGRNLVQQTIFQLTNKWINPPSSSGNVIFEPETRSVLLENINNAYVDIVQNIIAEPNQNYNLSFLSSSNEGYKASVLAIERIDENTNAMPIQFNLQEFDLPSNGSYKKFEFNFITGANTKLLRFVLRSRLNSKVRFKDVKLEKGNKATDWTPAPEDLSDAISKAQSDATTANNILAEIASDNKLSPSEKQTTLNEWNRIKQEYQQNILDATKLNVTSVAYTSAYNTLNSYITPLLSNLTTTNDIVGTTFRANFNKYYEENVKILTAMQNKLVDAISKAQSDATTANNILAEIASDNKLSPSEKQTTLNEWNRIKQEYQQNILDATKLNVTSVAYTSAYNTLNSYITPLLSNLTTTNDIVGTTFRANFNKYYEENVKILTAMQNKLVDAIEIGGRNFVLNSSKELTVVQGDFSQNTNLIPVNINDSYTCSVDVKSTLNVNNVDLLLLQFYDSTGTRISFSYLKGSSKTSYTRIFSVFKIPDDSNIKSLSIGFRSPNGTTNFKDVKLEKGNKATDWTPAPEDVQKQITALDETNKRIENITSFLGVTIDNNVIATGLLMVGNEFQSNAGISGLNESGSKSVRLWAGGTAQNRAKAAWMILDDGTERTFHSNGNLATERGLIDGSPVFNFYHKNGFLLFKLDPNRGLVNVAYTQESWTLFNFIKLNNSDVNSPDSFLANEMISFINKIGDFYYIENNKTNYTAYEYFNGTIPSNANLEQYNGYKINNSSRTLNVPDSWYFMNFGALFQDGVTEYPFVDLMFISNGSILKTKTILINNI